MQLIKEIDIKPRSSLLDIIDFGLFYLYFWRIATFHFFYITHYASESSFMRKWTFSTLIVPSTSNLRTTCKNQHLLQRFIKDDYNRRLMIIYFHVMKIDVKLFYFPKDDKNDLNRILNLLPISMTGAIKVSIRWFLISNLFQRFSIFLTLIDK